MMLCSLLAGFIGGTALCLSLPRHYKQIHQHPPDQQTCWLLRLLGWGLLLASFYVCTLSAQWPQALILWVALLPAAFIPVIVLLAFRPHALITIAISCVPIATISLLINTTWSSV